MENRLNGENVPKLSISRLIREQHEKNGISSLSIQYTVGLIKPNKPSHATLVAH